MARWPIQIKLLLLLLGIALLPLVFVTWLDYHAMLNLGSHLAGETQSALTERSRAELSQTADQYAAVIRHQTELLELIVRQQAREVEQRLATEPAGEPADIVFDTDVDRGDRRVAVMPYEKHLRRGDADVGMPVQVSYDTQVFRLPPGSPLDVHRKSLQQLASMTNAYRFLHQRHDDLIFWQYTTLESGLHSVYPGHGGYPKGYEPRQRRWYLRQRHAADLLWHPPLIDASTRQVLLTVSMPIFAPGRQFAGVTAIDVPVTAYLAGLPLQPAWAEHSHVFIVTPEDPEDIGKGPVYILAKQAYETGSAGWDTIFAPEWLSPPDTTNRERLIRDMAQRRGGVIEADYAGEDSLWAYRSVGTSSTWLLIIVPSALTAEIANMAHDAALASTRKQVTATLLVALLLIAAALGAAWLSARAVTRPVLELANATRRVSDGDFEVRTRIETGDELQDLGEAFNVMVPYLKERFRFAEGIRLAREVQQNLIPANPPRSPDLDIAGVTIYCEETGGDYYDFLELGGAPDNGRIGIAIGDVSGHGISSALVMATARALLHSYARQSRSLAEIMMAINDRLTDDVHAGRFMTLFYLVVEPAARLLRWVSAGHGAALLFQSQTGMLLELGGQDIPLGVDANWTYNESMQHGWLAGDVVLMTTDGVWESRDPGDTPFGKERLRDVLRQHAAEPARAICEAVTGAVRHYRQDLPQTDDITVVVMKALR
ncbi:MAG: SpoIIE family protein phosphatase [Chromatiales bacterium]